MYTQGKEQEQPLSAAKIQNIKVLPTLSESNGAISCNDMASAAGDSGNIQSEGCKRALSTLLTADP